MGAWIVALILALLAYILRAQCARKSSGALVLPPGPWGLPLIGHLHLLGDLPHSSLEKMAKKYGPIMSLRLGLMPAVVVSSPKYAELFLKTHDLVFCSRPMLQALTYMSYGRKNLIFAPYGPYWRSIRKLCTLELLSSSKVESSRSMRQEEVAKFIQSLIVAAESGSEIDISARIESVIENLTYQMVFGMKDDRFNFKPILQEGVKLAGLFNLADYIPYLGALDVQGLGRQMKACNKRIDGILDTIIDEHVRDAKELNGEHRDFIDVMLSLMETNSTRELQLDRDCIKSIVLDMLAAAMDTSSNTAEWVVAELLKHPRVMKLVQEELENVVGLDHMVEEKDFVKLEYLKLVIMESMRIHPVAPFLIPRESLEDVTVEGYFIPKKSRVLINTWAIGRDPDVWSDNAEEFYPERFVGTNLDVQGHDFRFLPFGSGRRKCPGLHLGMTVVQLVVAQLVHCFNLALPDGMSPEDLDMEEEFGLTLPRANHLRTFTTYRLHMHTKSPNHSLVSIV